MLKVVCIPQPVWLCCAFFLWLRISIIAAGLFVYHNPMCGVPRIQRAISLQNSNFIRRIPHLMTKHLTVVTATMGNFPGFVINLSIVGNFLVLWNIRNGKCPGCNIGHRYLTQALPLDVLIKYQLVSFYVVSKWINRSTVYIVWVTLWYIDDAC